MDIGDQKLSETDGNNLRTGEISFFTSAWGNIRNAIIGCSAAVLFGLAVLLMSILSVTNPQKVFPEEMATGSAETIVVEQKIDYYLPYPGILPDNPLYKLKALRDKVRLWLIFDEGRKAERELLYADKRINAALALVEGGKISLGTSTATKAEKYLEQSVDTAIKMQKLGQDVKSLLLTLNKAVAKHAQVLQGLLLKTQGDDRDALEASLRLTQSLQEKVSQALRE